jgi:hypothetical protein
MPDESTTATSRCPWCSTSVPAGTEVCPSCGAALVTNAEAGVPGLTAIDAEAVLRNRSQPKSRGGLLGFLSGETGDTVDAPTEAELASLAPPNANVRIEMLRLEIEAERQRLESEGASLAADVAEETGTALPAGLFGDVTDVPVADAPAPGDTPPAATPPGPEARPAVPPPPGPEATPGP